MVGSFDVQHTHSQIYMRKLAELFLEEEKMMMALLTEYTTSFGGMQGSFDRIHGSFTEYRIFFDE